MVDDPGQSGSGAPRSVLIVDDDDAIRAVMHQYIERFGFVAHSAETAEKALEMLRTTVVDVVITDILLPGRDGLALTDEVRRRYDCPVIVMTGYSGDYSYTDAIQKGASDFVFKPVRFEELLLRLRRVLRERDLARERDRILKELETLAITDELTKLYNARYFYRQLEMEAGRCTRYNHHLTLLLMDIDHFKNYNDTYGHLEGDKVLARLGQTVKSGLRRLDSAYRYGGEEFTAILPETRADEGRIVADRIKASVKNERFDPRPGGEPVHLTISIGVTQYAPPEDIAGFVQRAARAMYISKQKGRDRVTTLAA
ncbi:MAG: diguanylate cyclase [Desulfobacteraceae bacterium]|nr:diguanylate cyclase [Desulfobacteraceae bacterium]